MRKTVAVFFCFLPHRPLPASPSITLLFGIWSRRYGGQERTGERRREKKEIWSKEQLIQKLDSLQKTCVHFLY